MNNILRPEVEPVRLALRLREAARALGVSDRTLWAWTKAGTVPHVRQGKTILYPVASLARWLEEQTKAAVTLASMTEGVPSDPC